MTTMGGRSVSSHDDNGGGAGQYLAVTDTSRADNADSSNFPPARILINFSNICFYLNLLDGWRGGGEGEEGGRKRREEGGGGKEEG